MEVEASYSQSSPPRLLSDNFVGFNRHKQNVVPRDLPAEYKQAAKALQLLDKQKISYIENVLDPSSSNFVEQESYYLAQKTLKRLEQINYIIDKLGILTTYDTINPWIVRVLVTEILFCKHQQARSNAKEIEIIKFFEESMRDMFVEAINLVPYNSDVLFPVYVRINVISISIDDCIRAFLKEDWTLLPRSETYEDYLNTLNHLEGKNFMKDFHISELLVFPPGTIFYEHPGYLRGKFLLQDKGSCLSSFLLNPKPGSVVLDICAAPGLKTNHLANIMNNNGLIIANDNHPLRYETLSNLVDLTDAKCVQTCQFNQFDIHTNAANTEEIRYILLDPTCSYSGLFFKNKKNSSTLRLQRAQYKLASILRYCLQTFPNLKRLVFTTCTIYPEEGEKVITDTLKEIGNSYTLLNVKEMLWNKWRSMDEDYEYLYRQYECSEKCLRTVPELDNTPGYFIAVFERNFDVPVPPFQKRNRRRNKKYDTDDLDEVNEINSSGKVVQSYVSKEREHALVEKVYEPKKNVYAPRENVYVPKKEFYAPQEKLYATKEKVFMPKEKMKVTQMVPMQNKDNSIFAKVKKMFHYQNKVEKATFVKNKINKPLENKYRYVSDEYKNKQQQQQAILQKTSQMFSQQKVQPSFSQKTLQQNPKPFPIKKPTPTAKSAPISKPAPILKPALVSYPILNKLKEQQFSQPTEPQYSQVKLKPTYSQEEVEPEDSQPNLLYSQPKLQSQFSRSLRHEQLGLVSYPILNKLITHTKYYDNEEVEKHDERSNQLYP